MHAGNASSHSLSLEQHVSHGTVPSAGSVQQQQQQRQQQQQQQQRSSEDARVADGSGAADGGADEGSGDDGPLDHEFNTKTYVRETLCDVCNEVLAGVARQVQ